MKYGFVKVAAAVPAVKVADVDYNVQQIESIIAQAEGRGVEVIVFPELCITGYTCQDLFKEQLLLDHAEGAIITLLDFTRKLDIISIIGLPVIINGLLYNCAAVIQSGQLLGIIPKTYLPNYAEFYEKRWFASAQDLNPTSFFFAGSSISVSAESKLFVTTNGMKFGVEICEDVWAPIPPSNNLALSGADIIFNLSASNELIGKHAYLKSLLAQQSARTISGYVYASSGFGESTQDLVYGGNAMIYENGLLLIEGDRFSIQPQIKACQIDIEKLRVERCSNFRDALDAGSDIRADDARVGFQINLFLGITDDFLAEIDVNTGDARDDDPVLDVLGRQIDVLCDFIFHHVFVAVKKRVVLSAVGEPSDVFGVFAKHLKAFDQHRIGIFAQFREVHVL